MMTGEVDVSVKTEETASTTEGVINYPASQRGSSHRFAIRPWDHLISDIP